MASASVSMKYSNFSSEIQEALVEARTLEYECYEDVQGFWHSMTPDEMRVKADRYSEMCSDFEYDTNAETDCVIELLGMAYEVLWNFSSKKEDMASTSVDELLDTPLFVEGMRSPISLKDHLIKVSEKNKNYSIQSFQDEEPVHIEGMISSMNEHISRLVKISKMTPREFRDEFFEDGVLIDFGDEMLDFNSIYEELDDGYKLDYLCFDMDYFGITMNNELRSYME